ncbi:inorganic diphosphatase [Longitalea arenae]|uniref:inorganic diphosphatase n=1 Tax=Longitalea arenae TaxID=2812558 RepID=UPI001967B75F|nr:inorganic diphosphatase [Longitalea arenae]
MSFVDYRVYVLIKFAAMDIIVETPKGSAQKYSYDKDLKLFRFQKVLAAGLVFPFDFGFIPGTRGEDGDPLDVMVISEYQGWPGCVMDVRIIGCLPATETYARKTIRNDRYIAILEQSAAYDRVVTLEDLPSTLIDSIRLFFSTYLQAEGKTIRWETELNALKAMEQIKTSL